MLIKIRPKRFSDVDESVTAPTRGRRIKNQTRLERLHELEEAQSAIVKRRVSIAERQLQLQKRRISEVESWTIRQLDQEIKYLRAKSNLPINSKFYSFIYFDLFSSAKWM